MVEDTSLKVDPKSCQLNISINTLLTSAKEKLKLQEIENWGDTAKKLKRRSEDILNNVHKKAKGENGEQPDVELQEEEEAFQWSAYLKEKNATAVSKSLFRHIVPECMCGFEAGMKLEVPNKDYKNTYWLATIVTKASPLILVRYEGFHDSSECDFWCNTLTDDIHPVGWCARTKHALKPPKAIQHKEKNWYTYLIKNLTGARKASENLFLRKSHPAHYLRAGQYVEVIDQYNPTCYWLARINEVFSGRLFLQYEGWVDKNGEFCCYYLDESLRAVGYGMRHGLTLYPPKGSGPFSHVQFNQITEKIVTHSKRSDNSIFKALFSGWRNPKEHKLSLGMKLEAVHPLDPTNICVASVARVFDAHHFLVKIDDLIATQEEIANCFIAHKGSAGIFEIGFCHKNGLPLQQPRGYNGKFTWEGYLKYTKSLAAPTEFFGEVETFDQKLLDVGMKLEAVDLENKSNICVCTISRIVGPNIWLKIDGDTRIEQIHSITSTDVFPVDWCESTGHELQWPRLNTLEQKNRISSLRHTATRKNRLEVLRKGKLREKSNDGKEVGNKKEVNQKQKRSKDRYSNRGRRRGVSRNPTAYDNSASDNSPIDTSIAIVCISRLANELNSEESIKEAFHLDAQGRLPRQVVTIDDDDDDIIVKEEKPVKKYDEKDLDYFSVIRVKPNDLTKIEEEMFEKKLQENEANQGLDMDAANNTGASGSREKRSLSSVVAMLRASRKQPQLLDYKPNSSKHSTEPVSETSKPSTDNILIGDQDLTSLRTDAPIRIPGKGDFQVVEKIVSQEGGKNKITLKLGKPINTANSNPVINNSPVGRSQDSTTPVGNLPKTDIKNMHELTNMARSHKGLDEILRNRCAKVRSFCRNLPKNPLLWTKNHVATFIKTADCAKYSNLFVKQEIDGHSFLLLTVQELHHVLGIHLGPAMKIHDYIFTLQQLVNEAYQNNHDVTVEEKPIPDGEVLVVPQVTQVNNRYEENAEQEPPSNKIHVTAALQKEIKDAFGSEPQEKISCEPKIEQTLSKPDVVRWVNNIPESSSKPVYIYQRNSAELHTRETLKDVTEKPQVINEPQVFTRGEYSYIPINPVINPTVNTNQIAYYPVPMYRFGNNLFPIPANYDAKSIPKQYIPIRFIDPRQIQKENIPKLREIAEKKEFTIQADEEKILSNNNSSSLTIRTVGTLPSIGQKRKLENNVYLETEIKETVPVPEKRIPMPSFPAAIYDTFLRDVEVTLNGRDLWGKFHAQNTEMVITRSGRRIFPSLQVTVSGMNPNAKYVVFMDLVLVNDHRYKFEYESSQWLVACDEVTKKPEQLYIHPESPNLGNVWMKAVVDFTKCKLTNNISDRNGHMVVHSMHKYQPRIIVAFWDQSFELLRTTRTIFGILSDAMKNDFDYPTMKKFIFPETQFIAVTAYQNTEITNLKIQSNPFARGFRLEGKGGKKRLMKNNGIEGSMDANQDFDNDSENEFNASEDNCASQVVEYEQYRRMNKLEDDPINRGNVISIQAKQNSGEQEGIRSMADLNQFRENESINKFEGHRPDVGVNANQYNEFLPVRFDPGGLVKQEQVTIQSMKDNFTQKVEDGLIANLHHTNQTSTEYNLTENKEQGYQGVIPVSQSHDKITSKFQIPSSGSNSFDALVTNSAALPNLPKESMDSNGNIKVENYS